MMPLDVLRNALLNKNVIITIIIAFNIQVLNNDHTYKVTLGV